MPQTRTALRALRKAQKRRLRNLKVKKDLKENIKKFKKLLETNIEEAKKFLPIVYKKLDMAAQKKTIHKNKAARQKSKLAIKLNKNLTSTT